MRILGVVVTNVLACNTFVSSNSSRANTFTFRLIPLAKSRLIVLFYGVPIIFGSFNAKSNFEQFNLVGFLGVFLLTNI